MQSALRQDIQVVVLQQSKDNVNQFSGSESECAFLPELIDLMELEVIVAPTRFFLSSNPSIQQEI